MGASIRTSRIRIDGIDIALREAGSNESREAVVLVHGNPGSGEDFSGLIKKLGENRRVLAPDMPGFGKSDRPADFEYTVEGYSNFLGRILDDRCVEKVHLGLHDFGGAWGLNWAASNQDRVQNLLLFNIGLLPGYKWHKFARIWRTPILGEINMLLTTKSVFRMLLDADNPKPFPTEFIDRMYADMDWPMKRGVLKLYRATSGIGDLAHEYVTAFKGSSIPTLVIWGEGDRYIPVRYADMQKDFFEAEVHTLPDVGHWPMIDAPTEVEQLVLSFLNKNAQ